MNRLALIAALLSSIALADSLGPVPSTGSGGCVNGICDAGLYVVGGGPSVGTDTSGDLVLSGAPLPSYIIPETGTVFYTHVNATDLHNGTDKRGGVWTQNGTVPFNAGPLPSVGPFTDSNYFSQTSSPAGVAGGPFTIAMLVNVSNVASGPVPLSSGSYYAQIGNSGWSFDNNGFFATSTPLPGSTTALLFLGADSSGNIYSQVNNGPVTSTTYTTPGSPGTTVYIGRYFSGTGYGFTGTISEIMISNAVASHAAFNSIYSTVQTEIAPVVTTQYPTFFPSETVGNFLYVDGGFQVGGASGISPVFIGSGPFDSAYAGIWIGQSAISATQTNFTFLSNGGNYTLLNSPSGQLGLAIGNGEILICDPSLCAFTNSYSASGAGQLSMWVGVTTPATIAATGVAAALSVDSSLNVNLNLGTGNAFQIANDGGVVTASINSKGAATLASVDAGSAYIDGLLFSTIGGPTITNEVSATNIAIDTNSTFTGLGLSVNNQTALDGGEAFSVYGGGTGSLGEALGVYFWQNVNPLTTGPRLALAELNLGQAVPTGNAQQLYSQFNMFTSDGGGLSEYTFKAEFNGGLGEYTSAPNGFFSWQTAVGQGVVLDQNGNLELGSGQFYAPVVDAGGVYSVGGLQVLDGGINISNDTPGVFTPTLGIGLPLETGNSGAGVISIVAPDLLDNLIVARSALSPSGSVFTVADYGLAYTQSPTVANDAGVFATVTAVDGGKVSGFAQYIIPGSGSCTTAGVTSNLLPGGQSLDSKPYCLCDPTTVATGACFVTGATASQITMTSASATGVCTFVCFGN